jgi:hypothetical protein
MGTGINGWAMTNGIREAKRLLGTPAARVTVNHAH